MSYSVVSTTRPPGFSVSVSGTLPMGALPNDGEASTVTHCFAFHLSFTLPAPFFTKLGNAPRLSRLKNSASSSLAYLFLAPHVGDERLGDDDRAVRLLVVLYHRHQRPRRHRGRVEYVDELRVCPRFLPVAYHQPPGLIV